MWTQWLERTLRKRPKEDEAIVLEVAPRPAAERTESCAPPDMAPARADRRAEAESGAEL